MIFSNSKQYKAIIDYRGAIVLNKEINELYIKANYINFSFPALQLIFNLSACSTQIPIDAKRSTFTINTDPPNTTKTHTLFTHTHLLIVELQKTKISLQLSSSLVVLLQLATCITSYSIPLSTSHFPISIAVIMTTTSG